MPGNIQEVPLSVIKSWPTPNYVDPVRRSWIVPFAIIWQVASTIPLAIRLFVRSKHQAGSLGLDDVFISLGWMFAMALTTTACVMALDYGVDRHTWDVPHDQFVTAAMLTWLNYIWAVSSTTAIKISVLLFHRRLVHATFNRTWRILIWSAIGVTIAYFTVCVIALFLVCQPLEAYWKSYDFNWKERYYCADGVWINYFVGIVSVLSDTYAVLLPFGMVGQSNLQISWRQKLGLYILFGMGIVVVAAGVVRAYWLVQLGIQYDTSWVGANLLIWQVVEMQLAIIVASAPSLRKFARRYLKGPMDKLFGSAGTRTGATLEECDKSGGGRIETAQGGVQLRHYNGGNGKQESDIDTRALTRQSSDCTVLDPNLFERPDSLQTFEKGQSSWLKL